MDPSTARINNSGRTAAIRIFRIDFVFSTDIAFLIVSPFFLIFRDLEKGLSRQRNSRENWKRKRASEGHHNFRSRELFFFFWIRIRFFSPFGQAAKCAGNILVDLATFLIQLSEFINFRLNSSGDSAFRSRRMSGDSPGFGGPGPIRGFRFSNGTVRIGFAGWRNPVRGGRVWIAVHSVGIRWGVERGEAPGVCGSFRRRVSAGGRGTGTIEAVRR